MGSIYRFYQTPRENPTAVEIMDRRFRRSSQDR